jgi:hypothetical protein
MTDEDICGHPTQGGDGPPCQHPASEGDSCWLKAHGGSSDTGRPSIFTDELAREAIAAVAEVYSFAGTEERIGVGEGTINGDGGWLDQNLTFTDTDGTERDFSRAFMRARGQARTDLVQGGLTGDYDSSFTKYMLRSSFDQNPPDKTEVTGEGGGPVQIEFSEEIVETSWGSDE